MIVSERIKNINLQLFAESGTVVNTFTGDVNAYTGAGNQTTALESQRKTYYNTVLLQNSYPDLRYQQLGRRENLPANHGQTLEWRRPNKMPHIDKLVEGVIPEGKKIGMTSINVSIAEYGAFFAVTKQVKLHAVDPILQKFTEELAHSAAETIDCIVRNELLTNTNIMCADVTNASTGAYVSTPATPQALATALATAGNTALLTPDTIHLGATQLRDDKVPFYSGNDYIAVIHPYTAYDLIRSEEWEEYHKYVRPEDMYNGEIGKLHGARFVETSLAPIVSVNGKLLCATMLFGRDSFGVVDVSGSSMETIIKSEREAGGPLNQFGTCGVKCETACKILYPERFIVIWHTISQASRVTANCELPST